MTEILLVNAASPEPAPIARAAAVLRAGGLVAFPTETVYGLGADALDPDSVARIFAAKGRPANNPLIVHVAGADAARRLVALWPEEAERLAARFWPGPLTLVLPKADCVPDLATAGAGTVAVRVPAHPVALALLRAVDMPIAAPSANRSNALSPTLASHVLESLPRGVDLLLDAGPTSGGLESTVLDLTGRVPRVLRPGLISPRELEQVLGTVERAAMPVEQDNAARLSPGMLPRHYAPRAVLECAAEGGGRRVAELCAGGQLVGWLKLGGPPEKSRPHLLVEEMPLNSAEYSARLYAALHALDDRGVERIVADLPPDSDDWLAVRDRLRRASTD